MNIVDSSAWLEYIANSDRAELFRQPIEDVGALVVPSITLTEVYNILGWRAGFAQAALAVSAMRQGHVIDLTADLALGAASLGIEFGLPLADSIIFATARLTGATLWTQDAHFASLPGIRFFQKPAPR